MEKGIPNFLYSKLEVLYNNELNSIISGYNSKRKVTFRVNTSKTTVLEIEEILKSNDIDFSLVPWYSEALIIENVCEEDIKKLSIYENGEIYLQSLSSMMPALVVNPLDGESILDMAASPGGKTTQMANLSNNMALIMACEKNKIRADRLKYNIEKQGSKRINVVVSDARKLDEFFSFDKILLDAPCSGSGTLNISDSKICEVFTEELVSRSVKVQKELLSKAISLLKVGGELVYSTCSILKEENEEVVNSVLTSGLEIVPIDENLFDGIPLLPVSIDGTICVCPTKLYEGFYIAKIRKIK
ncbi:MAG: RsmB/NOP family class I SAM-dependent RNA methyltransferase [Bacilli bacterium]|nr:RsmB/NOP family class I SAM-dependent RNA methyltransferase [Bacilli bacterium]